MSRVDKDSVVTPVAVTAVIVVAIVLRARNLKATLREMTAKKREAMEIPVRHRRHFTAIFWPMLIIYYHCSIIFFNKRNYRVKYWESSYGTVILCRNLFHYFLFSFRLLQIRRSFVSRRRRRFPGRRRRQRRKYRRKGRRRFRWSICRWRSGQQSRRFFQSRVSWRSLRRWEIIFIKHIMRSYTYK